MYEQEKKRATHLLILLVYTFLTIGLTGESLLMGWEKEAVVLLILGVIAGWVLHITEMVPESTRIWLYFILTMLTFFFYGIHETSVYDLAPLMIVVIVMYSSTENCTIIKLCVATYFLTMCYDLAFVLGNDVPFTSLTVTRTILHFVLVYLAGYLIKVIIQRRQKEKANTDNRIARLEETNRRTEDFLTNVSHELRTPINAVTGITTVMLKNEEDEDKKKDLFSIQMAGNRLFNQIEDILDYTEIDTGRVRVSEDTYMISSVVNDIIAANQLSEREDMPELIFDIDVDMPSVLIGDERKIRKILKHLIDNAIKFTPKGGIYVRMYALPKPYGVNLCIKVSDTGVGIAAKELERITELFYQSSEGRNRKAGGLGLGLSIVHGMVNAMEGFIQVESAEGSGTTVSISIPQKVADETPSMAIENRQKMCVSCFLKTGKYEVPEVRDYYNTTISHIIQGVDIPLHQVSSRDELERLVSMYQLTHLFTGKEEYEENKFYMEELAESIEVIVVAKVGFELPRDSRAKLLRKPFFGLPIINILNADAMDTAETLKKKYMACPGVRVLVVDDEPMNLMVAKGIFNDYQMTVKTAESGRKAIEICEKEEFDLIFLDHMMPEMDGVETLKRIRKLHADIGTVCTIIAFTANAVSGAREMFLKEGFDEFVSKPIELLELERVLKKVLPKSSILYVDETERKGREPEKEKKAEELRKSEEEKPASENALENAGIHSRSGLQYCCGDKEFYGELLSRFAGDAKEKETQIREFFEKEDYENYGILVHALKSTAKMIGADSLSENARYMEEAAKGKDAGYIREYHEELLKQYSEVVQCISDVLGLNKEDSMQMGPESGNDLSQEELIQRLTELKEALNTFEADKVESAFSKLNEGRYQGISVDELLCDAKREAEDFEFGVASEKVETLIGKVEGGEVG